MLYESAVWHITKPARNLFMFDRNNKTALARIKHLKMDTVKSKRELRVNKFPSLKTLTPGYGS